MADEALSMGYFFVFILDEKKHDFFNQPSSHHPGKLGI